MTFHFKLWFNRKQQFVNDNSKAFILMCEPSLSRSLQLSGNGKNISQWSKPISELDLKNVSHEEKMQKARCGLDFMQKALQLSELHESKTLILEELVLTKHCVAHHIGNCTNIPEPDFQSKETYKRKQWGIAVLKSSVNFLDELVKIQHHTSSKLPKPKHAWQRSHAFHLQLVLIICQLHFWKFVTSSWSDPVITRFCLFSWNFLPTIFKIYL